MHINQQHLLAYLIRCNGQIIGVGNLDLGWVFWDVFKFINVRHTFLDAVAMFLETFKSTFCQKQSNSTTIIVISTEEFHRFIHNLGNFVPLLPAVLNNDKELLETSPDLKEEEYYINLAIVLIFFKFRIYKQQQNITTNLRPFQAHSTKNVVQFSIRNGFLHIINELSFIHVLFHAFACIVLKELNYRLISLRLSRINKTQLQN